MDLAFFSFVNLDPEVPDLHRTYNRWHQLDHLPENRALPGVAWGDRWQRDAADKEQSVGSPEYAATDTVAMYWFRAPVTESVRAWVRLGEASFHWGRGPLLPGVRRIMLSFFRPVKGYAARSALVPPEVLPFRPHRGVHLTLTQHAEPHSAATHRRHAWEDRDLMPALVDVPGVAGGWTFTYSHDQRDSRLPINARADDVPDSFRIRLLYLEEDEPLTVADRIVAATDDLARNGAPDPSPESADVRLATTLHSIVAWQDW